MTRLVKLFYKQNLYYLHLYNKYVPVQRKKTKIKNNILSTNKTTNYSKSKAFCNLLYIQIKTEQHSI